jgi:hypothetical protein
MGRKIAFEVDGVRAVAELEEELSPNTTRAFWDALPLRTTLMHAKWSGETCFFRPGAGMASVTELENPVTTIYPGTLVARPRGTEALLAYGVGEYRWGIGVDYTTRLARIVENEEAFLTTIARVHDDGDKEIQVTRIDDR